jgi:hypothetical protein
MGEPSRFPSTPRTKGSTLPIARLAERQWGVVSRAQLLSSGLSGAGIARWIKDGRLHRVYRGVYAVGHGRLSTEGRLAAALLHAGPGAALSHGTAAWWYQLLHEPPSEIHVATPRRTSSIPGVCVHRPRRVERVLVRGLPVTPLERVVLDFSATQPPFQVRRLLAEADYRRRLDVERVQEAMGQGRAGTAGARRALAHHLPELAATRSVLEERFLGLCGERGIRLPELNVLVAGHLVDALWRPERVVVELDGHEAHARAAAVERDRRRELELRRAGCLVLRYTWSQVTGAAPAVAAGLAAALDGASSRPEVRDRRQRTGEDTPSAFAERP